MHHGQTLQPLFIETALDLLLQICLAVSIMQTSLEKKLQYGSLNSFYVFYPIREGTRDSFNQSGACEYFNQSGAKTELNATEFYRSLNRLYSFSSSR